MARTYWTDERLDTGFRDLRGDIDSLRTEIHAEFADLRRQLFAGSVAIIVALIGVVGAVLIAG